MWQGDDSGSRWRYGEKQQEPRLAAFPVRQGTSLKRGKVFTKGWCAGVSWLQNPDPIIALEREEPKPVAKPHGTGDPKLNKGQPGGDNEGGRAYSNYQGKVV
ncbi:hypothetical protein E2C01_080893 [Portunus trituberculatus]|uniref:Uncharacterized protein n=1 Tax=Portunus trituberculatus TaxID=210409 RepID=A0A5B7INF6_PORTR|nr:hypothetical protein [Portunus trituberculatus]